MNVRFPIEMFLSLLLLFFISSVLASDDAREQLKEKESKKEKAIKVLKISGAAQTYVEAFLEGIKQAPVSFEEKVLYSRFATYDSIMEYLVPVYIENYTKAELDAMIDFYSSPAGQSIVKKSLPVVMELRKASMEWGMKISVKVNSDKARIAPEKDK